MRQISSWLLVGWSALAWAPAFAEGPAAWPQWGGPLRNGTSPESGMFGDRPVRLREVWRRPVEDGAAAIVAAGGRLVTLGAEEGQAAVFAVDAATGKDVWRRPLGASPAEPELVAASTPATDGRLVFVLSPGCRLLALGIADGAVVWERDLRKEYDLGSLESGCVTSPLLDGDRLVVQVNGEPDKRVVAFAKATGAVLWTAAGPARRVETSPAVMDIGGVRQVVIHDALEGRGGVHGLRLDDGALLWSIRFKEAGSSSYDIPLPIPGDRVAVTAWDGHRTLQVRSVQGAWSAELLRTTKDVSAHGFTGHAVSIGGQVYGMAKEFLTCLDAATGKTLWKEKTYQASLAAADGHLLVLSRYAGVLRVVEASPDGYREKASREVFQSGAPGLTPPTVVGRRIYLRNSEEMVALEVEK